MLEQHELVVLKQDMPGCGLRAGDVGAVVHIYEGGAAYEVEFITGDGRTLALQTLQQDEIRQLTEREILHTRVVVAEAERRAEETWRD
jgi:hypothetical protein